MGCVDDSAVNRETDIELIERYAPVYLFHDQERVLPVGVNALEGRAAVTFRDGSSVDSIRVIRDIASIGEIDFWKSLENDLDHVSDRKQREKARKEIRKAIAFLKGGHHDERANISVDLIALQLNRFLYGDADAAGQRIQHTPMELGERLRKDLLQTQSVCYVHVARNIRISWPAWDGRRELVKARTNYRKIEGYYDVVYYILYLPFNVYTNVHEADWDGVVAVIVPTDERDKRPTLAAYFGHHGSILVELVSDSDYLAEGTEESSFDVFLDRYQDWVVNPGKKKRGGKQIGWCYGYRGTHPLVFVAHGSHAAYPAPGMTVTGLDVDLFFKKIEVPFGIDIHPVGRQLLPVASGWELNDDLASLTDLLSPYGNTSRPWVNIVAGTRKRYVEIDKNTNWALFPGKWGEDHNYQGWSGISGFLLSKKIVSSDDPRRIRDWLEDAKHPLDDWQRVEHITSKSKLYVYPESGGQQ